MKKFFVALDADTYEIGMNKISLTWGQTISDWLNVIKQYSISADDIVVGHSIGATVAVLYGKGHVIALSPSPITEETKHLIADIPNTDLPFVVDDKNHLLKKTLVHIYVGENESEIIKECARIMAFKTGGNITFIPDADHSNIVEKIRDQWVV